MKLTGTFLDEVSLDIPSQNWGRAEWDLDFATMKAVGIDTVIMIRCGHNKWAAYPSDVLRKEAGAYTPPADLVEMFLELSDKYGIDFYFGIYDSGEYWWQKKYQKELDISLKVAEEVWSKYGHHKSFKGWYITWEVGRNSLGLIDMFTRMGRHCKDLSGGLPVMISPYIEGVKDNLTTTNITPEQHEKEWNEIMGGIAGAVDIVAFQDGHVDFHELQEFLHINNDLARKYGLKCWSNTETFDRDMPIKFLPIKWEKLLLKLDAAEKAGLEKAITFEFSHFLSPNSDYRQAKGLFDRYCEHFGIARIEGR